MAEWKWQPMSTVPKDRHVLLLMEETIPDVPDIRVGRYTSGEDCEALGYREYAKHGGWTIWNCDSDFWIEDANVPTRWADIPTDDTKGAGPSDVSGAVK